MKKIFYILFTFSPFTFYLLPLTLYSQLLNSYINDFRVNDDATNKTQHDSRVGVDSAGNFVVAWNDLRNSANNLNGTQVYCQIFDKTGNRIGNNFRIGQDTTWLLGLTVLSDSKFIVFWYRIFNNNFDAELYFQRFNRNGSPLSSPTRVVDSVFSSLALSYGDISSDSSGNFVITWKRLFGASYVIVYCQRYDSAGNRIGMPVIANEAFNGVGVTDNHITVNSDASFFISWKDNRNNLSGQKGDIFMQRFNSSGIKIGNNVKVNDDNDSTRNQVVPWMDGDKNGRFVIVWADERNFIGESQIYFQIYDSTGAPVGTNKRADQSNGFPAWPKVGMRKDGKFLDGWSDNLYAGRYQYYGIRYNRNGDTIGGYYMLPNSSPGGSTQIPEDIKIFGDRVYSVWYDTRNGNGDIYCNVRSFQNPDTIIIGINPISNQVPLRFKLYPPYPNPFNPETKIKYELPKQESVSIRIYDITGKEVTLTNYGLQARGVYEVTISGERLSSGIYFLQLITESGSKAVQKMILLK